MPGLKTALKNEILTQDGMHRDPSSLCPRFSIRQSVRTRVVIVFLTVFDPSGAVRSDGSKVRRNPCAIGFLTL